ncbi:hypothetical protein BGW80DRAFT_1545542 [Lactifluus volemus]|nr:hypothetical protein BGW80DRAFT_1545542 [Lactifluus volemus]
MSAHGSDLRVLYLEDWDGNQSQEPEEHYQKSIDQRPSATSSLRNRLLAFMGHAAAFGLAADVMAVLTTLRVLLPSAFPSVVPKDWEEITMPVALPLLSSTSKTDINVLFSPQTLTVHVQNCASPCYTAARLWGSIAPGSSFWTWDAHGAHAYGLLTLHLEKQHAGTRWPHVFDPTTSSLGEPEVAETLGTTAAGKHSIISDAELNMLLDCRKEVFEGRSVGWKSKGAATGKFKVPIGGSAKAGEAQQTIAEIAAQLLELKGEHIEVVPSTAAGKRSIISDDPSELYAIRESLEKYTAELREGGGAAMGLATRSSLTDGKVDDEVGATVGIEGGSEISITIDRLFFISSCRRTKRVRRADGQCGHFQIHQRQKFNMCFALTSVALATLATTVAGVAFAMSFGRASDRSARLAGGRASAALNEDHERICRDYEFRIATMQTRIAGLERELEDSDVHARQHEQSDRRVKQLEEELDKFRQRSEEHSAAMLALQKELDNMRQESQRGRDQEARRAQQDEEELQIMCERCERLEEPQLCADSEVVEQLHSDMEALISKVSDLSRQNDELMLSKDSDLVVICDLDAQLKEYKRKYEQAKTELRSVKATSLTAIDSLLSAGRSNAPMCVLTPMKSIVNTVTTILDDVRSHSQRHSEPEDVRALEERVEATLSNLIVATKTHATSSGLSPMSLLDAVVSHVSTAITELGRVVLLRRMTKAEQDHFAPSSSSTGTGTHATNGFVPALRTVEEVRSSATHQRGLSESSSWRSDWEREPFGRQLGRPDNFRSERDEWYWRRVPWFGKSEDAWTELRPYLEAQTESIIYVIQSVLLGMWSPTPSPTLNENLTQIITIMSSIVAVCHDNLPASQTRKGSDIQRELSEHANQLSEMQTLPEVTKES